MYSDFENFGLLKFSGLFGVFEELRISMFRAFGDFGVLRIWEF